MTDKIETLIAARMAARKAGDDTGAEAIRTHLLADGIVLEDHADGSISWTRATPAPILSGEVAELRADLHCYIERTSEESGYGFARPANPHDFHPDAESCSPDEIAAHKAACEAYDKGEYTPERGSEWVGKMHILRAPWGIGGYTFRDPEAVALLARLDALAAVPATPAQVQQPSDSELHIYAWLERAAKGDIAEVGAAAYTMMAYYCGAEFPTPAQPIADVSAASDERRILIDDLRQMTAKANEYRDKLTESEESRMELLRLLNEETSGSTFMGEPVIPARADVSEMVNRFLGWSLPKTFAPDCGISFKPLGHPNGWPIGTNLLSAVEAKAMFEHCAARTTPASGQAAQSQAVAVWKLVPELPNAEMQKAGVKLRLSHNTEIAGIYAAMLAAAPTPPAPPVRELTDAEWVSVADRMPASGQRVAFAWVNSLGKPRTSMGNWNARFTQEAQNSDEEACEYNEDNDTYYLIEGWNEWGWELEFSAYVSEQVTHWMPLPAPPAHITGQADKAEGASE